MRLIYRPHFHAWTRATSWAAHTASRTRFARSRPRRAQPERRQRTGRRRKQAGDVQDSSDSSGRGSRRRAPPEPGADAPRRVEHAQAAQTRRTCLLFRSCIKADISTEED